MSIRSCERRQCKKNKVQNEMKAKKYIWAKRVYEISSEEDKLRAKRRCPKRKEKRSERSNIYCIESSGRMSTILPQKCVNGSVWTKIFPSCLNLVPQEKGRKIS